MDTELEGEELILYIICVVNDRYKTQTRGSCIIGTDKIRQILIFS